MIKTVSVDLKNIKLDQFLKWSNVVSSGGEAKILISSGKIKVNGIIEYKRGLQLLEGDIIEIEKEGSFKIAPSRE